MTSGGEDKDVRSLGPTRAVRWLSVVAGLCGVVLFCYGVREAFPAREASTPDGQWDFGAYYHAVKVYDAGGNPWSRAELIEAAGGESVLWFIYPHHTLPFFRLFVFDDETTSRWVFLVAKLACVAALIGLWARCFVRPGVRGWFLAFAVLGYNATLHRDLVAGNVSLFEQTLIWFGLWALLRGRLWLFCLLIIAAAQFKMLPIGLLGLLVFVPSRWRWRYLVGSVAVAGAMAAAVYLSDPEAVRGFLASARGAGERGGPGAFNPCVLSLAQECFGSSPQWVSYGLYAAIAAVVLACFLYCVRGRRDLRGVVFLGVLTYALIIPRMKDYSYVLLLAPTFEVIRATITRPGASRMLVIAVAAVLALPGLDFLWGHRSFLLWDYRPLFLAVWVWILAVRLGADAWRDDNPGARSVAGGSG